MLDRASALELSSLEKQNKKERREGIQEHKKQVCQYGAAPPVVEVGVVFVCLGGGGDRGKTRAGQGRSFRVLYSRALLWHSINL
jgi:hypothetical protein